MIVSKKKGKKNNRDYQKGGGGSSSSLYKYFVEGNRTVYPKHKELQDAFVQYLGDQGIECTQDKDYVDVRYQYKGKSVLVEVKPAEIVGTKYAIRAAIGQLFEYRYIVNKPNVLLHIVLDEKPKKDEINFVQSLGVMLSYRSKVGKFITEYVNDK